MANFAVIEDGFVINTITADSKSIAEEVTGKVCIEFTTESAETGGTYDGTKFYKKKPYPSWILNSDDNWEAPVAYPAIDPENPIIYIWDENSLTWIAE